MYNIRLSDERGVSETIKVKSYHSFTFDRYYNQNYLSWSDLRVLNEYHVTPQSGLAAHAQRNQLIMTVISSGILEYKDSKDNTHTLSTGDIHMMTAQQGREHYSYNPSQDETLRFLQIWIMPHQSADQRVNQHFTADSLQKKDVWVPIVVPNEHQSGTITQGTAISYGDFGAQQTVQLPNEKRYYWLQVLSGHAAFGETTIKQGDGLHYYDEDITLITQGESFKAILLDMQIPK